MVSAPTRDRSLSVARAEHRWSHRARRYRAPSGADLEPISILRDHGADSLFQASPGLGTLASDPCDDESTLLRFVPIDAGTFVVGELPASSRLKLGSTDLDRRHVVEQSRWRCRTLSKNDLSSASRIRSSGCFGSSSASHRSSISRPSIPLAIEQLSSSRRRFGRTGLQAPLARGRPCAHPIHPSENFSVSPRDRSSPATNRPPHPPLRRPSHRPRLSSPARPIPIQTSDCRPFLH